MKKNLITHEIEETIATYCAENDKDLNVGNAYDIFMETYKNNPIIETTYDEDSKKTIQEDKTGKIAIYFEHQDKTIFRVNEKVQKIKQKLEKAKLIEKANEAEKKFVPNLSDLVDNLYKLNIVDGDSYLALICFLMQVRYTRNHVFQENDKTCVFFNGVARNGKSATAKAICDVEEEYGTSYRVSTGRVLEADHEEAVWKSHINYFDEVKPTDIHRELLLTIINGGYIEINPKNKTPYKYPVNTNNIFTSNDQINLKQRRVSIVKFGKRLNGRPLGSDTLKNIMSNIINSLPSFDYYYDIYSYVSKNNENRTNPLAIEGILTYLDRAFSGIKQYEMSMDSKLRETRQFSTTDIYSCIKTSYSKQTIMSERREAIRTVLEDWKSQGILEDASYSSCTTKFYSISYKNYLDISNTFSNLNTKDEDVVRISKIELYSLLKKYFQPISANNNEKNDTESFDENSCNQTSKKTKIQIENLSFDADQNIIDKINEILFEKNKNNSLSESMDTIYRTIVYGIYFMTHTDKIKYYDFVFYFLTTGCLPLLQYFDLDFVLDIYKTHSSIYNSTIEATLKEIDTKIKSGEIKFTGKAVDEKNLEKILSPFVQKMKEEITVEETKKEETKLKQPSLTQDQIVNNQCKTYYKLVEYIDTFIKMYEDRDNPPIESVIKDKTTFEACRYTVFEDILKLFKEKFGNLFDEDRVNLLMKIDRKASKDNDFDKINLKTLEANDNTKDKEIIENKNVANSDVFDDIPF